MTDLISRNDAIEAVADNLSGGCSTWAYLNLEKAIKALPSADAVHIETYRELYEKYVELKHASAEAVQGEWVDMNTETTSYYPRYKCSLCGNWANRSNYCPSCGARMKGGDDE